MNGLPIGSSPPRVVVVDDDEPMLTQLCELLLDFDIDVVGTATDGAYAVAAVRAARECHGGVDVVVMDMRIPRMNGLDATRAVKATFPEVAVVLHSAYAAQLATSPRDAGVFAEVAKGSHPSLLVDTVLRACRAARTSAAHAHA